MIDMNITATKTTPTATFWLSLASTTSFRPASTPPQLLVQAVHGNFRPTFRPLACWRIRSSCGARRHGGERFVLGQPFCASWPPLPARKRELHPEPDEDRTGDPIHDLLRTVALEEPAGKVRGADQHR